jgi:hypothetical protein
MPEDSRGAAVAEALGGKSSQQEGGIKSGVGRRQEIIATVAWRKHVGRQLEKIAVGVRWKLASSSTRASMLLGSNLRGGRLVQQ